MSKQYIFKITHRQIVSDMFGIDLKLWMEIFDTELNIELPKCYLDLGGSNNTFVVRDIIFQSNEDISEDQVIGYLKGYFCFQSEEVIERSLSNLQNILNEIKPLDEDTNTTWRIFTEQFNEWFKKKLKPCLQKELELYEMYCYPYTSMDVN